MCLLISLFPLFFPATFTSNPYFPYLLGRAFRSLILSRFYHLLLKFIRTRDFHTPPPAGIISILAAKGEPKTNPSVTLQPANPNLDLSVSFQAVSTFAFQSFSPAILATGMEYLTPLVAENYIPFFPVHALPHLIIFDAISYPAIPINLHCQTPMSLHPPPPLCTSVLPSILTG